MSWASAAARRFELTHDDHASFQPAWSPDSSQIAYRRTNPDDIAVMNADGMEATP